MTSDQSHPKEQTSIKKYQNKLVFIDRIALKRGGGGGGGGGGRE